MYYSTSANFPYYVGPKIYLILYPSLGKLTTHIAITKGAWHYNDVEEACYRPNPSQSNFCVIGTMGIDFFKFLAVSI
jgi:hypothetical protein